MIAPKPIPRKRADARPGDKGLTIAAGFRFKGGVLICADTEMSDAISKHEGTKIARYSIGGGIEGKPLQVVFTFAGNVPFCKRAITECIEYVKKLPRGQRDNDGVKCALEEGLKRFHCDHIYPHPGWQHGNAPIVELVIGMWSTITGRESLFSTNETVVNDIPEYDCVGIGRSFAIFAVRELYKYGMSTDEIVLLATHMLKQTKDNVPGCGKRSQFTIVGSHGETSVVSNLSVSVMEHHSERFAHLINQMWFQLSDPNKTAEEVSQDLSRFVLMMKGEQSVNEKTRPSAYPNSVGQA